MTRFGKKSRIILGCFLLISIPQGIITWMQLAHTFNLNQQSLITNQTILLSFIPSIVIGIIGGYLLYSGIRFKPKSTANTNNGTDKVTKSN